MAARPRQADDLEFVLHEAVREAPVGYAGTVVVPNTAGTLCAAGEFTGIDICALESRFHEGYLTRIFQLSFRLGPSSFRRSTLLHLWKGGGYRAKSGLRA
jgi:hypothetical protein